MIYQNYNNGICHFLKVWPQLSPKLPCIITLPFLPCVIVSEAPLGIDHDQLNWPTAPSSRILCVVCACHMSPVYRSLDLMRLYKWNHFATFMWNSSFIAPLKAPDYASDLLERFAASAIEHR